MSARAPGTSVAAAVVFDLERFELVGERLEVAGRWSGIRGRRFLRPTLTAMVEGAERRTLAELEHKPWAAQDGDWWEAAFPWPSGAGQIDVAELAVAPDIAVSLPGAGLGSAASKRRGRSGTATRLAAQDTGERRPYIDATPGESAPPPRRGEHEALVRALADERAQTAHLRTELERSAAAETEAASALARRDAALRRVDELSAERDTRVAELRAEVENERAAVQRAAQALDERDAARAAHERAAGERDAVRRERDQLLEEHRRLLAERDRARAAGPAPGRSEPAVAAAPPTSLQPAAEPSRRSTRAARTVKARPPGSRLAPYHDPRWLTRALAVTALLIALVLLTIVLRSV